jgi:hypothetical protein
MPFALRLAIPNAHAGAIIGRQGAKIKEIREVLFFLNYSYIV